VFGRRGSCSDRDIVYFAKDGVQLVLLLLGGDKSTQAADVVRAQESWMAYQEGRRRGKTK
jgi:putative component of toxin-antitoxin plasmid stabilization module